MSPAQIVQITLGLLQRSACAEAAADKPSGLRDELW